MTDKNWIKQHLKDEYVKKAFAKGYRSRAAYKLLELDQRDQLLKPGMLVIDLGAAPGGWSQVAQEKIGAGGEVIAIDLLPMAEIPGVTFVQGDFNQPEIFAKLTNLVEKLSKNGQVDLVISDMAPNITGNKSIDQPRSLHLVELAWDCAQKLLRPGGCFLAKIFQGAGVTELIQALRKDFETVKVRKPKASRARSSEVYVLAKDFR